MTMSIRALLRFPTVTALSLALVLPTLSLPCAAAEEGAADGVDGVSSVSDADRAHAAELYRDGVEAYRARRFKDAIDAFAQADSLSPSAALSFNAALAYEQLLDTGNALRMYREYLRRSGTREKAAQASARVKELEQRLAARGVQQLSIFSEPEGATISVDGRTVGVTPWTSELAPGRHRVLLSMKAHEDVAQDVELPSDHAIDVMLALKVAKPSSPAEGRSLTAAKPAHPLGPWPWVALGVGAAALATSVGFELSRRAAEDDARHANTQTSYADHLDAMDSRQTAARWFGAAGGGLLLASGVLFFLDARASREASKASVSVDSGRYFVSYRSSF